MRAERREVVVGAAERDSSAPVAVHEAARGLPHGIDPAEELGAEPEAAEGSERESGRDRPGEGRQHASQDLVGTTALVADEQGRAVGEPRDERANDLRLRFRGLVALRFLRLDPAVRAVRLRAEAQVARDRLAVATDEAIGEPGAARSASVYDRGEPVAPVGVERALQRVGLLDDPVVEIGQNLMANGNVDEGAERQRRGREQREIESRQPEAGAS